MTANSDLIERLRERARIRRQIANRKSVQEGKSDRIADLLDEAALAMEKLSAEKEEAIRAGWAMSGGSAEWTAYLTSYQKRISTDQ